MTITRQGLPEELIYQCHRLILYSMKWILHKMILNPNQGWSQPHSPGWVKFPLSSLFPQIWIKFSYFPSNFSRFLPHSGQSGGWIAHPWRHWLHNWSKHDNKFEVQKCLKNVRKYYTMSSALDRVKEERHINQKMSIFWAQS